VPLVLAVAAVGCSSPTYPEAADVVGAITMMNPETATLGVRERNFLCTPSSASTPCVSVNVIVTGKLYMQEANGQLREISFGSIPMGTEVLAWTKGGSFAVFPPQVESDRVIVQSPKSLHMAGAAR
jgi:hypothetical protein